MGTHPIFESDFDCLTEKMLRNFRPILRQALRMQQVASPAHSLLISDAAATRLAEICDKNEYLRVSIGGGGCSGYSYEFDLSDEPLDENEDLVFIKNEQRVVTDRESIELMNGSTIDYKQELIKKAFVVADNPLAQNGCSCGASFSIDL